MYYPTISAMPAGLPLLIWGISFSEASGMRTEFLMPPLLVSDNNMINFSKTNFARSDNRHCGRKFCFYVFIIFKTKTNNRRN
jgi:hypothetical protein